MALSNGVEVKGLVNAENVWLGIKHQLEHPELAAPLVFEIFNKEYKRKFREWNGYMVDTGATRDAWTRDSSPHAVREVHHDSIDFGSDIYYNRYHQRALLEHDPRVDDLVAEAFANHFTDETHIVVAAHMRGQTEVRSYIRAR